MKLETIIQSDVMCFCVYFFGFFFLWEREEKGMIEDKMAGWHHQLNGHEFEPAPGNCAGQGSLGATVHGVTESGTTEWLNIFLWFFWTCLLCRLISFIKFRKLQLLYIHDFFSAPMPILHLGFPLHLCCHERHVCSVVIYFLQPHGLQPTRILEWVAISFSRVLPDPRIKSVFLASADRFFTDCVSPGKPLCWYAS